jgi:hypothetical protein
MCGRGEGAPYADLRHCTYAGRPFGEPEVVGGLSTRFGRCWAFGRPPEKITQIRLSDFG